MTVMRFEQGTAGALRARGVAVPHDIPDDVQMRITYSLRDDGVTLDVDFEIVPKGVLEHVSGPVRIVRHEPPPKS